jgi:hypothetical protein
MVRARRGGRAATDGDDVVTLAVRGGRTVVVEAGRVARFGRSSRVELPIAQVPEDALVSRRAGFVDRRDGRVAVANTSTSGKLMRLVPPSGAPFPLAPAARWSAPSGATSIELVGCVRSWVVELVVRTVRRTEPAEADGPTAATDMLVELTDAERLVLAAVCEPLLRVSAKTQPNGPSEAAPLLPGEMTPKAVARRLDGIVDKLIARNAPGLAEGRWRYGSLAHLAVDHGLVVPADVDLLAASRPPPRRP